jgi:pilus assembly protein Flp/PilA
MNKLVTILRDRRGATALEYGLVAALIAIAIIGTITSFTGKLEGLFTGMGTTVSNVSTSAGAAAN